MQNPLRPDAAAGAVDVAFRALAQRDLAQLHRWLNEPEVVRWYSPAAPSRAAVERKYLPRIAGASATRVHILLLDGRPAGLAQTYHVADYPDYAAAIDARPGWAGVDYLIGEPGWRGRGLARRIVAGFVAGHVAPDPAVTVCAALPAADNIRSIRALAGAGFRAARRIRMPPGSVDQLMLLELPAPARP